MAYTETNSSHYRTSDSKNDLSALITLCFFAFLALGVFIAVKILPTSDFTIGQFFSKYGAPSKGAVSLGDIKLGSTINAIQKDHPDASQGITSTGALTMAFTENDAVYIVWYGKDGPNQVAYKARQNRIILNTTEDEYVGNLTKQYGAPSLSSCSSRIVDGLRDCHFSWWVPGDIRLDISSRQFIQNKVPSLKITMQITDTHMAHRLQRKALHGAVLKAY